MSDPIPSQQSPEWHTQPAETVLQGTDSSAQGLTHTEADGRLATHGPNRLPEAPRQSQIVRFLLQFHNILIYVLLGAAVITAIMDHWVDTWVILAVVVANAVIGFVQEGKAEKAMDAIRHMLAPQANVIREGERLSIKGEDVVPGDIVLLEAGDKVPADLRLLTVYGLQIQEAILTGESVPTEKNSAPVAADAPLGDRACMAFSGTFVTSGQGRGVVVATAGQTEIGRISGLLSDVETLTTPLVSQMGVFAKWLTGVILTLAALLLAYGYGIADYDFTEMFMAVVGLSVAAIPEGLPAVLTITLAVGVQAMARRNAIVRRLPAIETLGSVSVICTDKTGTLTRNEMMVASVRDPQHDYRVDGEGYTPTGAIMVNDQPLTGEGLSPLQDLARAAILCNDSALKHSEDKWTVSGDPMEGALLAFAGKAGLDGRAEHAAWTRVDAIPFDSRHRFMATLNRHTDQTTQVFVKGAPEQVLEMCRDQQGANGATAPLDPALWHQQAETIAARGERVLAFAMQSVAAETDTVSHAAINGTLTFLGMVGMIDPPRTEAVTAIAECQAAGIRVKMITGDHAKTASAIGRQVGLQNPDTVLTGADLEAMDDAALRDAVLTCDIFARTSPEHKLRLVAALQSHTLTVAMTGDGVNDAPALKRADAGIAMGQKGSEAAREAADLVLADDHFATIAAAVREGRTVYDNLKKVISWTLPTNAGEAMTIIAALLSGMTLPITPIQILWINLITAVTLGISLAFEPTEDNTMRRPPRPRTEPLLTGSLIWTIVLVSFLFLAGVFGIFQYAMNKGYSVELARTMAVNMLVVMEIFHLFFIRNLYGTGLGLKTFQATKIVWLVVGLVIVAQFAITYIPLLQTIFGMAALPLMDGLLILAIGIAVFALTELEKQVRMRVMR